MLTFFQIKNHFCGLDAKLTVDLEADAVDLMVKWKGRIRIMQSFKVRDALGDFSSPEKCQAWLSVQVPVADGTLGRVESWHWRASRGIL